MKAKVNDRFSYDLGELEEGTEAFNHIEVLRQEGSCYQIRKGDRVFNLEVLRSDARAKQVQLAMEGYVFEVNLEDELDDILQMIRQKSVEVSGSEDILAPIPGLIKKITKVDGSSVEQGESLLILEAMKMENTIQAPVAGDQIGYHVAEGDHVVKGQKLITIKKLDS